VRRDREVRAIDPRLPPTFFAAFCSLHDAFDREPFPAATTSAVHHWAGHTPASVLFSYPDGDPRQVRHPIGRVIVAMASSSSHDVPTAS
jgi:hypothetical protein